MKLIPSLLLGAGCALLASCNVIKTAQQPIGDTSFNPLGVPGDKKKGSSLRSSRNTGPQYTPGQWVETAMPNSTFFRTMPRGSATADKVLKAGTPLKVIKNQGSFVKVELDSGDVGFVPSIMVVEGGRGQSNVATPTSTIPAPGNPGEVPIIPVEPPSTVNELPPLPNLPPVPSAPSDIAPPPIEGTAPLPTDEVPVPPSLPDLPPPPQSPDLPEPQLIE